MRRGLPRGGYRRAGRKREGPQPLIAACVEPGDALSATDRPADLLLTLDEAVTRLAGRGAQAADLVKSHGFAGLPTPSASSNGLAVEGDQQVIEWATAPVK
jgi:hypothetical protein